MTTYTYGPMSKESSIHILGQVGMLKFVCRKNKCFGIFVQMDHTVGYSEDPFPTMEQKLSAYCSEHKLDEMELVSVFSLGGFILFDDGSQANDLFSIFKENRTHLRVCLSDSSGMIVGEV